MTRGSSVAIHEAQPGEWGYRPGHVVATVGDNQWSASAADVALYALQLLEQVADNDNQVVDCMSDFVHVIARRGPCGNLAHVSIDVREVAVDVGVHGQTVGGAQ